MTKLEKKADEFIRNKIPDLISDAEKLFAEIKVSKKNSLDYSELRIYFKELREWLVEFKKMK